MTVHTTLSKRGFELATGENIRDKFKKLLSDPYDPVKRPNGFINIGVAENYAVLPEITEYINEHIKFSRLDFSYGEGPWGCQRLRQAMAKHMERTFPSIKPLDPEKILFTNGCTALFEMLGFTIGDQGDGLLLGRPIYQAFQMDFGMKAKMIPIYADFDGVDQFSPKVAEKYEEAMLNAERNGTHVRAMMLCNPHNPLGQCYPKDTIIALMKLCDKYKVHLLSDEIYASSVYEVPDKNAVKFTSALSFDTSPYISKDYLHVVYGLSKDFAAGGTRLGCMYSENDELNRAMSSITQFHWSGNPSQEIATAMLEDEEWLEKFLQLGRERLAARNKLTRKILDDAGIRYHAGSNAGFFIWVDLRPYLPAGAEFQSGWEREQALVARMMEEKVFLTDGKSLSAEEPGFFRVIFSQEERVIEEGLRRLFKAIGKA